MGKKSNNTWNKNNKQFMPNQDRTEERIKEKIKEKKENEEQQVLSDDRVKSRIQALDDELKRLKEKEDEIKQREELIINSEKELEEKKNNIKEVTIREIREKEQDIRAEEYRELLEKWNKENEQRKIALEQELECIKVEADNKNKKADEKIKESNEYYDEKINQADKRYKKVCDAADEYSAKSRDEVRVYREKSFDELSNMEHEVEEEKKKLLEEKRKFQEEKRNFDFEKDILNIDAAYYKKKSAESSDGELNKLKYENNELKLQINMLEEASCNKSKRILNLEEKERARNGKSTQEQIDELEKQLEKATEELNEYANMPSLTRIKELENTEEVLNATCLKLDEVSNELSYSKTQLSKYNMDVRERENQKTMVEALKVLNNELQDKMKEISNQYNANKVSKFKGLLEIDKEEYEISERSEFNGTLETLVQYIRNYGASPRRENPLYYSEEIIRVFIASLAASEPSSRLLILQGLSGTGKSSLPRLFKDALDIKCQLISVQPSWRDNRELLGYDNDFTNRFKETEFTKALYRASSKYRDDIAFIVLDEINLARIEYYFADFLSELEQQNTEWAIPLTSSYTPTNDGGEPRYLSYDSGTAKIIISKNIWFIGTANNDDSTSLITDKVYDRAQILDMDERAKEFVGKNEKAKTIKIKDLQCMFEKAKNDKNYKMNEEDWNNLDEVDGYLKKMDITFGNRMRNQLNDFVPVYVACGGTKESAIDYFLAHKILRKLDEKFEAYIQEELDIFIQCLDVTYGDGKFEKSIKKIADIKKRNFSVIGE